MKKSETIVDVISALLVLLFVYAALSKLLTFDTFKVQIERSPFIGNFASWLPFLLPFIELVTCILFFIERFRMLALYASLALMVAFTVYIIAIIHFSEHLPCICGGVLSMLDWHSHLVFNLIFLLLAVFGIAIKKIKRNDLTVRNTMN